MQSAPSGGGNGLVRVDAVLVDHEQLAAAELALGLGADEVERAGLGGDRPAVVEPPEHERPEAVRVAEGEQLPVGERAHGVRALEPAHRVRDRLLERGRVVRDQGGDQLGVRARAELDPVGLQLVAELAGVDEVAVVAERDRARAAVLDDRLRVRPLRRAGRRVARVPDRELAVEPAEVLLVEDLRDEAHLAEHRQVAAVRDRDPRRLLAAVLERVQAEVREPRDVAVGCADAEDAAHG